MLNLRVDADMPDGKIACVNQGKCKKGWLANDGLRMVDEPSASSRESRKSLQGSLGFIIEDVGTDHILLCGITGGSSKRVHSVAVNGVSASIPTYQQITVHADSNVPSAAAANIGLRVLIGTGWTGGTKISAAVKDDVWASNGSAWVKQ